MIDIYPVGRVSPSLLTTPKPREAAYPAHNELMRDNRFHWSKNLEGLLHAMSRVSHCTGRVRITYTHLQQAPREHRHLGWDYTVRKGLQEQ